MKPQIKKILMSITPQDLENGCERQVEELTKLLNKDKLEIIDRIQAIIKHNNPEDDR